MPESCASRARQTRNPRRGVLRAQLLHLGGDLREPRFVGRRVRRRASIQSASADHRVLAHPARRDRRRADAHARRVERLARVERHGVVVEDDARLVERLRATLPVTPLFVRSTRSRWLSVPPVTSRSPRSVSAAPSALAFSTMLRAYALNSGCERLDARRRRWRRSCGCAGRPGGRGRRPCRWPRRAPSCRRSSRRAGRGTSCGSSRSRRRRCRRGRGGRPAHDEARRCARCRPRGCAPTSSAIDAEGREVERARVRRRAAPEELRAVLLRERRAPGRGRCGGRRLRTPYGTLLKYLPVIDTVWPCVRWPPGGEAEAHDRCRPALQNAR